MKLLLHICCGPCAVYPTEILSERNVDFTGMFFNPNIHPLEEFKRRGENLEKLASYKNFNVIYYDDFDQKSWENYKGPAGARCRMCYALRFEKTARVAAENGYDAFSTTLLVSPYQKHEMIIDICNGLSEKYNIKFYYEDWREGYRQGQQKAREYGLYRQKYCGCIKSVDETTLKKLK